MKTVVFGGTGSIGRIIVDKLLKNDKKVLVLTRQAKKPQTNVEYVIGSVLDPEIVGQSIDGDDNVIVSLGFNNSDKDTMSRGTANIIAAMEHKGAKRIVCLSSHGVGESWNYLPEDFREMAMNDEILKNAFEDHGVQEEMVKNSKLDWTIVRPTEIVDKPELGTFTVNQRGKNPTYQISKYDVAAFMVDEIANQEHLKEICTITD